VSRAEEVDAELEALYAQVPEVGCKGLCTDACGPIDGGPRELVRMARAGVKLPPREVAIRKMASTPDNYECPSLVDGRCSTYAARPMVCHVWGASEDLPCPYGCRPAAGERLLTSAETMHLLDAATKAGTPDEPLPVEVWEKAIARPGAREWLDRFVPTPEATRPVPRKTRRAKGDPS
jgi:hypothetical protein